MKSNKKTLIENELKNFRSLLNEKTSKAKEQYERAKEEYEKTLKEFIIAEISGEKSFKTIHGNVKAQIPEHYGRQKTWAFIDERLILEHILIDYESWVKNILFETSSI